jgi:hypothetical protein
VPNVVARFKVANHFELDSRGAFVVGHVTEGSLHIGMVAVTGLSPPALTVGGVEFLDNASERKYWNALMFSERPDLHLLQQAFPVGSVILLAIEGT